MTSLLFAAAESGSHEMGPGPYIAAGIAVAVFAISAIIVRSFRDVKHRGVGGQTGSTNNV